MKNKNVQRRPIDEAQVDKHLKKLFSSMRYGAGDPLLIKYKSRFTKGQREKKAPVFFETKNNILSLGKKLEILLVYGNYRLVKSYNIIKIGHNVVHKSDGWKVKSEMHGI